MKMQELINESKKLQEILWQASEEKKFDFDVQHQIASMAQELASTISQLTNIKDFLGY